MTVSDTAEVAVITPTRLRSDRIPYLLELQAGLHRQDVEWQWVLALDGVPISELPARLRDDPRVQTVPLPRAVGAGAARNFALNEVTADWCTTADDDDLLPEGSLSVRLRHAREHGLGWCAGWSADLHPDGAVSTWRCPTPPGFHEAGDVWGYWPNPEATIPIGPTTLLARTDLIRGSGGYAALPQGEDYAYLVGITGMAPGALLPTVVYHYRKHPEQMTAQPSYPAMESRARQFAWRHGEHLASLRAGFTPLACRLRWSAPGRRRRATHRCSLIEHTHPRTPTPPPRTLGVEHRSAADVGLARPQPAAAWERHSSVRDVCHNSSSSWTPESDTMLHLVSERERATGPS